MDLGLTIRFLIENSLQVCAVGWEPNPAMTKYLRKLEASYERCGFRVKINTETGVGIKNTELKFIRMIQVKVKERQPYIFLKN